MRSFNIVLHFTFTDCDVSNALIKILVKPITDVRGTSPVREKNRTVHKSRK